MLDQAEAKVKIGMDDSDVTVGLNKSVGHFTGWSDKVREAIHPIHSAFSMLRMTLHAFGAVGVITAAMHLHHLFKELTDSSEEAKKLDEWLDKARESASKLAEEARKLRRELAGADKVDDLSGDKVVASRTVKGIDSKIEAKKREIQRFQALAVDMRLATPDELNNGITSRYDAEQKIKLVEREIVDLVLQRAAAENSVLTLKKDVRDAQKELNEERRKEDAEAEKESEKDEKEEKERNEQLHRLHMYHLDQEKTKKAEARSIKDIQDGENKAYQPSVQQILNSGWFSKHGKRFHSSWAANQEQDIQDMSTGIQEDIANFGMSDDIKQRMENVNKMKGELNKFLGATGTPEERIANATKDAADHLKAIREAFYNTE